jgi:hypothetical protein
VVEVKLRVRDNSIRLRLTQTEVSKLDANGRVCARICFPNGTTLEYALESSTAVSAPATNFTDGALTVCLPAPAVRAWASSDQVSIASDQELADGGCLQILVEKDFACLAPRPGEDESDMFPHPLEAKN